jgi:hypothetical protein
MLSGRRGTRQDRGGAEKYDAGASIRALAEDTGRSYGFIHRILTETGVTLRGGGGATRSQPSA